MKTYKLIFKQKGKPDEIRTGLDKLNATIIPAELKMAFPKEFKNGTMSVEVIEE
jgi:hypothetical protein